MARDFVPSNLGRCLALTLIGLAGCAGSSSGGALPPPGAIYFPTAIAALPAEAAGSGRGMALVSSANLDRRFATGWVSLVDVGALLSAQRPADAVVQQVSVPSIGGPIALDTTQSLANGGKWLAFIGHRGTHLLSIIEISLENGTIRLSCGDPAATAGLDANERRTDCDSRHLFALDDKNTLSAFATTLGADDFIDPYAVATSTYLDPTTGHGRLAVSFLSHLVNDTNSLLVFQTNPRATGSEPFLVPERLVALGDAGVGAVAFRPDAACATPACVDPPCPVPDPSCAPYFVAASSRFFDNASEFSAIFAVAVDALGTVRETVHNLLGELNGTQAGSMLFDPGGARLYATNDTPDGLAVLDAALTSQAVVTGAEVSYVVEPAYRFVQILPQSSVPSELVYLSRPEGNFVVSTAFAADEVDIAAVTGGALVPVAEVRGTAASPLGSRPFALASLRDGADDLVLVGTLYDHGITVIRLPAGDVAAASVVTRVRSTELGEVSILTTN